MSEAANVLDVHIDLPEKLEFLLEEPIRYKGAYGGRGSAKSWSFARGAVAKATGIASDHPERILCARETQESLAESVHRLVLDQAEYLGVRHLLRPRTTWIEVPSTDSVFLFSGIRTDPRKIKSTEGVTICWVEEAEAVSEESWEILIPTIREDGSEIWITFNPRLRSDATWQRFVINPPPDSKIVLMNWRDNPWFPEVLNKERIDLKRKNPALYQHIWEGECGVLGNTFYEFDDRNAMRKNVKPPIAIGVLEQTGEKVRFIPRDDGYLEVWEIPDPRGDYCLGGDVSMGKEMGDQHSGHVLKRDIRAVQVARMAPHLNAAEFGRKMVLLAKWYGVQFDPTVAIERTGLGLAAVIAAQETGYKSLWHDGGDCGWNTSTSSRPMMLARLGEAMHDTSIVIQSEKTMDQLDTFITTATGKPEAADGCKDDEVLGLAIAYQMILRAPKRPTGLKHQAARALHEYDPHAGVN